MCRLETPWTTRHRLTNHLSGGSPLRLTVKHPCGRSTGAFGPRSGPLQGSSRVRDLLPQIPDLRQQGWARLDSDTLLIGWFPPPGSTGGSTVRSPVSCCSCGVAGRSSQRRKCGAGIAIERVGHASMRGPSPRMTWTDDRSNRLSRRPSYAMTKWPHPLLVSGRVRVDPAKSSTAARYFTLLRSSLASSQPPTGLRSGGRHLRRSACRSSGRRGSEGRGRALRGAAPAGTRINASSPPSNPGGASPPVSLGRHRRSEACSRDPQAGT